MEPQLAREAHFRNALVIRKVQGGQPALTLYIHFLGRVAYREDGKFGPPGFYVTLGLSEKALVLGNPVEGQVSYPEDTPELQRTRDYKAADQAVRRAQNALKKVDLLRQVRAPIKGKSPGVYRLFLSPGGVHDASLWSSFQQREHQTSQGWDTQTWEDEPPF